MRRLALPIALTVVVWAAGGANGVERAARARFVPAPWEPIPTAVMPDEAASPEAPIEPEEPGAIEQCPERSSLRGIVVDPEGFGVPDAKVCADFGRVAHSRGYSRSVLCARVEAATDSRGDFVMEPPDVAQWAVVNVDAQGWVEPEPRAAHKGFGTSVVRLPRSEAWPATALPPGLYRCIPADARALFNTDDDGRWADMRIVLERGLPVEGSVVTEADEAVAGALVTAYWQDDLPEWRTSETRADYRGRFSIRVPCVAFLGARVDESWYDSQAREGPVSPGTAVRLVIRDLVSLQLRVRGPSGPIRGVAVTLKPAFSACAWPWDDRRLWPAYDEPSGMSRIDGLLPRTYELEVDPQDPDCLPAVAIVSVPGDPVEIRCPPSARIEGVLEGDDVGGFEITWTGPGNRDYGHGLRFAGDCEQMGATVRTWNGRFLLEAVADGSGDIYARREGDPRCAFVAGYSPARGFLRLGLAKGRSIRGQVEGRKGLDLSALHVRAVAGDLAQGGTVTADGSFEIVGLPPLAFRVELRSEDWLHDAREGVVADTDGIVLRVRLPY